MLTRTPPPVGEDDVLRQRIRSYNIAFPRRTAEGTAGVTHARLLHFMLTCMDIIDRDCQHGLHPSVPIPERYALFAHAYHEKSPELKQKQDDFDRYKQSVVDLLWRGSLPHRDICYQFFQDSPFTTPDTLWCQDPRSSLEYEYRQQDDR